MTNYFLLLTLLSQALPTADGYRGIWYMNQPSKDEYVYKYSGGFATYPQQQSPQAIYSKAVNKTFFVYGGTVDGKQELLHLVSYFDHKTKQVPQPTILLNKQTDDAHDNPVFSIDEEGYLWIFSNAHGTGRPSFVHKSRRPYDITEFELVQTTNFSYGHPWYHPGLGFLFLHTKYEKGGRSSYFSTSPDGRHWTEPALLARMELGHYQITAHQGKRTGTAFNLHPAQGGLNSRTNLYYLETEDLGKTWRNAARVNATIPLQEPSPFALVHDYQAEQRLVYLKDMQYDREGRPVILYLTSVGYEAGPKSDPRIWHTARWTGTEWQIRELTRSDHNYDFGSLYCEADGSWRVVAATAPGPIPQSTGGDLLLWETKDQGRTWKQLRQITRSREFNPTYPRRPVNAHPDFYAFWADGHTLRPSESSLYFTNRNGTNVWRLPRKMSGAFARPEKITSR